jgi:hypothetical protein
MSRWSSLLMAAAVLLTGSGCVQMMLTGAYFFKGMQTPPEFDELKGTKTAVVCRPLVELQYSGSDAADEIAKQVSGLMSRKISKIEMVNSQKIEQWTDEHEWESFVDVGRAVKSDYVIGLELEEFSLYQGQTIFQGRATVGIKVYDVKKKGAGPVYEKVLPRFVYPPSGGVATADKSEDQFRREFVALLAERIGRSFYPWDPRDDAALDSLTLD